MAHTSDKYLSSAIDRIIKETIKSSLYRNAVAEKNLQQKHLSEEDDDLFGDESGSDKKASTEKSDTSKTTKSSKTSDAEKEKLKKGDVTADDIVERMNVIRGGKSFKDESVASKLEEYIESLSKAERVALFAFLKALSQIVTGEIPADQVIDPADSPANVKMEKSDEEKKKSIKPNVIKAPEVKKEKKPEEDTSGPVPITPKKK